MVLKIEDIRRPAKQAGKGKRKARGIGSGKGKTAGRGHKGAGQRAGGNNYVGFEGGQMPLMRRIPKRGFTNKWKKEWTIVNIGTLQDFACVEDGAVIDKAFLLKNRIIRKKTPPCRVLGKGKLEKALTVKAEYFSETAKKAIEAAGGKAEVA